MNGITGGPELMTVLIALSAVISFAAAYAHCAIGFGFGILATATMTLFFSPVQTAAVLSLAITVLGAIMVARLWKHIDWRMAMPAANGMLLGKVIGVVALMSFQIDWVTFRLLDRKRLQKILYIYMVLMGVYALVAG